MFLDRIPGWRQQIQPDELNRIQFQHRNAQNLLKATSQVVFRDCEILMTKTPVIRVDTGMRWLTRSFGTFRTLVSPKRKQS